MKASSRQHDGLLANGNEYLGQAFAELKPEASRFVNQCFEAIGRTPQQWDGMSIYDRHTEIQRAIKIVGTRQKEKAQCAGRCTLQEAAAALEKAGELYIDMLEDLKNAARIQDTSNKEHLPVYAPGRNNPLKFEPGRSRYIREENDEVFFIELNAWLEKNRPRIDYRFPSPVDGPPAAETKTATKPSQATGHAVRDNAQLRPINEEGKAGEIKALSRKAIEAHFPKTGNWRGLFSREQNNGLAACRLAGKPLRYDLEKIKDWVVNKGHYTAAEVARLLSEREQSKPTPTWADPIGQHK